MSLEQPGQAVQPRVQRSQWPWPLSVGVGAWRLFRVLLHVLLALAKSYTVWEGLSREQRDAANRAWSGQLLRILGLELVVQGQARPGAKLVVSNHVSWLDIVAINAVVPSRFVSKAEVAHWPLIGRLVTYAGTLYLVRERRRDAMRVLGLMSQALKDGDTVAVFPEGTTGPGDRLLHFHPNLLQAAIDAEVPVQPVVIRYSDPLNAYSPSAAYVGGTTLLQSLWWVVSSKGVRINVKVLPLQGTRHADRRALATLLSAEMGPCLRD
jgi:1-acyl-sn-glycerol-3-phosphate acyltransferase